MTCVWNSESPLARLVVFAMLIAALQSRGAAQQLAFELPDHQQRLTKVEPGDASLTAICFLGTECPMAKVYTGRLNGLQRDFAEQGLRVVGVMSNRQDSWSDIQAYVANTGIAFEILVDRGNVVADRFGATRTPEVYLLDSQLKLRYHGRIDDQYSPGVARASAGREDLKLAIEELLAGKPVSVKETRALGCIIGKVKAASEGARQVSSADTTAPTFSGDIYPMLQRHCVECHRAGEIGPFSMERYEDVVGWADTMLETIEEARMPPWHADPAYGQFVNARSMPTSDKELLRAWIASGAQQGDPDRMPEPIHYTSGWQLDRLPDEVFPMRKRPFQVPKDGVVEYQYFVVDPHFTEDRWVRAAQVIPGSPDVVHHAIVFVRPPDGAEFQGVGWLTAYVPGQRVTTLPPGRARLIPAGSKLVFQMHYTPNGIPREDTTRVGLVFAEEPQVTHRVFTLMALDQEFEIPPEAAEHQVHARLPWLPQHGELLAATPHMHYRGKAFTLYGERQASSPSPSADQSNILLRIPRYDFNWQHTYQFAEPLSLDGLAEIRFDAVFDNSEANPFNPDSQEWVTWGDQTWEEMAVAFFEVSVPLDSTTGRNTGPDSGVASQTEDVSRKLQAQREAYVTRVFQKLDANGDGRIHKTEAGIVVRRWNFWRWDLNQDGIATEEEVRRVAGKLYR